MISTSSHGLRVYGNSAERYGRRLRRLRRLRLRRAHLDEELEGSLARQASGWGPGPKRKKEKQQREEQQWQWHRKHRERERQRERERHIDICSCSSLKSQECCNVMRNYDLSGTFKLDHQRCAVKCCLDSYIVLHYITSELNRTCADAPS